ncbi:MAG: Hexuranate transporter [Verrucomicrobia bacterium]|nr:Hexuranate transporter [Verrucomicrobiota bacterium]
MHAGNNNAALRSGYRWRILALLFAATTINYLDRSILGVLAPTLQYQVFHWSDADFASINIAFKIAYALGLVSLGTLIDRWGTKLGYLVSLAIWSSFGLLHAAIRPAFGLIGFIAVRFGLGFGEAGNFPAAIKTVAAWFPVKERALATGIFNAGSNVGAILAPLLIPLFVLADGSHWQLAFLITGGFSAAWMVAWGRMYQEPENHPRVSAQELAWIRSDRAVAKTNAPRTPVRELLQRRVTWGVSLLRFADAAWWFYLFWGGKFLYDEFGLDLRALALPLVTIYVAADVGSIGGGAMSSWLIRRGWEAVRARKFVMLACALVILPVAFVTTLGTRFVVDDHFFARLRDARVSLSAVAHDQLEMLRGRSYASARDFRDAIKASTDHVAFAVRDENAAIAAARSDDRYWIAVLLIALAAAGHQAWAANMFSLISDYVPAKSVGFVTGFSGMVGAVVGMLADFLLGRALMGSGPAGYFTAFVCAGGVYLVVLAAFHVLVPRDPYYLCSIPKPS